MSQLVERVQMERRLRGFSIRDAASAGGISNTTWGEFEKSGRVTAGVHRAVMQAFAWPETWQDSPPPAPQLHADETTALRADLKRVRKQLGEVLELMTELTAELRRRDADGAPPKSTTPPRPSAAAQ